MKKFFQERDKLRMTTLVYLRTYFLRAVEEEAPEVLNELKSIAQKYKEQFSQMPEEWPRAKKHGKEHEAIRVLEDWARRWNLNASRYDWVLRCSYDSVYEWIGSDDYDTGFSTWQTAIDPESSRADDELTDEDLEEIRRRYLGTYIFTYQAYWLPNKETREGFIARSQNEYEREMRTYLNHIEHYTNYPKKIVEPLKPPFKALVHQLLRENNDKDETRSIEQELSNERRLKEFANSIGIFIKL